jgi:hypothetical protein
VHGGVYLPEQLAGDADVALAHIGPAAIAGAGFGAYAALLLAGGRRAQVRAALLMPGRGLSGGGVEPDFDRSVLTPLTPAAHAALPPGCDPLLCALEVDPRPPTYAGRFATAARKLLLLEDGGARPPGGRRRAPRRRRSQSPETRVGAGATGGGRMTRPARAGREPWRRVR